MTLFEDLKIGSLFTLSEKSPYLYCKFANSPVHVHKEKNTNGYVNAVLINGTPNMFNYQLFTPKTPCYAMNVEYEDDDT